MRLAALFSGGKDSTYAVVRARQDGHEVVRLLSFASANPDSYMFHHPNIPFTGLLAEALGIPLTLVPTKGEKEKELADLEAALRRLKTENRIQGVAAGALASRYQYDRVAGIAKTLGLSVYAPAWQQDPEAYLRRLVREGFVFLITKVACDGLDRSWLGRAITEETLPALLARSRRFRFHPAGEGGEYESLVTDCPAFAQRLAVDEARTRWDRETGVFEVVRAHLEPK